MGIRKPLKGESLADKFPEIAKRWHPTKNGDLTPQSFKPGSHKKVWWVCSNNHELLKDIKGKVNTPKWEELHIPPKRLKITTHTA